MSDLIAIMVVYNTEITESRAYKCVLNEKNIKVIVCDNSTVENNNKELVENDGNIYISMQGNKGLSKAYNKAIDYIMNNNFNNVDYIILMDDDTYFPCEYFKEVREKINQSKFDIHLPTVLDESGKAGYLSPSIMRNGYCHRADDIKTIPQDELCGINSGMVIKKEIFKDYRYNEDIFLDYVDHNFIRDMKSLSKKMGVLDTTLNQNFSSSSDTKEKSKIRFKIFKKDINVFYRHGFKDRCMYHYIITRKKVNFLHRFHDLSAIFW